VMDMKEVHHRLHVLGDRHPLGVAWDGLAGQGVGGAGEVPPQRTVDDPHHSGVGRGRRFCFHDNPFR